MLETHTLTHDCITLNMDSSICKDREKQICPTSKRRVFLEMPIKPSTEGILKLWEEPTSKLLCYAF